MKREKLNREELVRLLEEHSSVGKVSAFLGIPYSTIYSWYKKEGIELPPSCMNIYQELREVPLNATHRSVILGSILGDGSLLKNKGAKNARLQIGHCTKQYGYLMWKKQLLVPFVHRVTQAEKPGPKTICGVESYSSGYYFINTIVHPEITDYYNKFYFRGHKRVDRSVIEDLDLLSLAVWMADDGSFTSRGVSGLRGSIATNSFTYEEVEILLTAVKRFYFGHASIANDGSNVIYMSGSKALKDFLNLIVPVLPKSIHYKFAPQRLNAKPPK